MNITRLLTASALVVVLHGLAAAQGDPEELVLQAKLRDIKESPKPGQLVAGHHPHFNVCNRGLSKGNIETLIDTTGQFDPEFEYDNRNPKVKSTVSFTSCLQTETARFDDWYNDKSPDVNRSFLTELRFTKNPATGMYEYGNSSFFPLDNGKLGQPDGYQKFSPGDPDPFGHLQSGGSSAHNYGFTLELHTTFTYRAGKGQVFRFRGDDDVWVFINGHLVMDIGGVHGAVEDQVLLDDVAATIGIVDGGTYHLDFFFAERHVVASNLFITTDLELGQPLPGILTFVDEAGNPIPSDAYWSPAKGKIYAVYTDNFAQTQKQLTITIRNKHGQAPGDTETVVMTGPVASPQNNHMGIWSVEIPLDEIAAPTKGNGVAEVYWLGEVVGQVNSHDWKGDPDNGIIRDELKIAYPDEPEIITAYPCDNAAAQITRSTACVEVEIKDQSPTKGQDTILADLSCGKSGDRFAGVRLVEVVPPGGVFRVQVAKNEQQPDPSDGLLSCLATDDLIIDYMDVVYQKPAQGTIPWFDEKFLVLQFRSPVPPNDVIGQAVDGQNSNTILVYVNGTSLTPDQKDVLNVTLTTPQGDSETIQVVESDVFSHVFTGSVTFTFGAGAPVPGSGIIEGQVTALDAQNGVVLTGVVNHPAPLQSQSTVHLISLFNRTQQAYIKDENENGRGDKVYIVFSRDLPAAPDSLTAFWNTAEAADMRQPAAISVLPANPRVLVADFTATEFAEGATSVPAGATPQVLLPMDNVFGGQVTALADSMGPIIMEAVKSPYQEGYLGASDPNFNLDTLRITLSEPLETRNVFKEMLRYATQNDYGVSRTVIVDSEPHTIDGGVTWIVLINSAEAFSPIANKGYVFLEAGGSYYDTLGNIPPRFGRLLGGQEQPPKISELKGYPPVPGLQYFNPQWDVANNEVGGVWKEGEEMKWIPPAGYNPDAKRWERAQVLNPAEPSVGIDPGTKQRLPTDLSTVRVVANDKYIANVNIYDNLGNFVTSFIQDFGYRGELTNQNRQVPKGLVSYLVWDMKDHRGQKAGQGAYVWRILFTFANGNQHIGFVRTGIFRSPYVP